MTTASARKPADLPGHQPVMLAEVLHWAAPAAGEIIVDGTFGGGGYSRGFLTAGAGAVLGIDRDLEAMTRAEELAAGQPRFVPLLGCFGAMDVLVREAGWPAADAVVLDVGVSSFQIDAASRGFSFQRDGPLDMRMGGSGPSAADFVNRMDERGLADVIFRLGEEKSARRIAREIVARRAITPFAGTLDLAALIETATGGRRGAKLHPATRTFQAIRMYVNDELGELARGLRAAERLLKPGGRLVVVAFHSLEDRLVKQWLRDRAGGEGPGSRHLPRIGKVRAPSFDLPVTKAIQPSDKEVESNPRARSAKLRVAVRTDAAAPVDPADDGMNLPPLAELETRS